MKRKKTVLLFFQNFGIGALVFFAFSGCASQRRVAVGLSAEMENYYAIYPSIEFDAAAVTSDEEKQIKSDGVDKYFAPGSALRKRLDPFTVYFSQEQTLPEVLPYKSEYWERWLKKKPVTLVLIANLPHSPDMPEDDPRVLYVDITKGGLFSRPVYVEIEPQKIVRIFDLPRDPRTGLPAENPKPGNQKAENRIHEDKSP
ncbi:MAG: hypothetical protein LBQ38_02435 [Spirochaetaceae bacterium]|nr:hypothetical protein [Spirochaetaceae bacterium]